MSLTIMEYVEYAMETEPFDMDRNNKLIMSTLGLAGETGEIVDLIKKKFYHPHKEVSLKEIVLEMGDVLWYLASLSIAIGVSLEEVAKSNIFKLKERWPNGFPTQEENEDLE